MRAIIVPTVAVTIIAFLAPGSLCAQGPEKSDADFADTAKKLRQSALHELEPQVAVPTGPPRPKVSGRYPWKTGIVTTLFWIGSAKKSKGAGGASAWDPQWQTNYGGFDNPKAERRRDFVPIAFVPRLNPFYIALPYNDVAKGTLKPEAKVVIPWFGAAFVAEGKSVCRDRWVAIRNSGGKVCYAQWNDCGPFRADHWQYVFGNEKPRPNANGGAGLNVSPAVHEYLALSSTDVTDWKFVEVQDVPQGPWALYGGNNPLVRQDRRLAEPAADEEPAK
jgi:hypothetical protein